MTTRIGAKHRKAWRMGISVVASKQQRKRRISGEISEASQANIKEKKNERRKESGMKKSGSIGERKP